MLTLALNILDIAQNSIRARATFISIIIIESTTADTLEINVGDNGSGIAPELLAKVTDPFVTTRTTRKTGLGLPLLKYHSEVTGGGIDIKSSEGTGTQVKATFKLSHPDRQPLGDIAGVMTILMTANPGISFLYTHFTDKGEYRFSSDETKKYLGIDDFSESSLLNDIKDMINQNLKDIGVSEISQGNI